MLGIIGAMDEEVQLVRREMTITDEATHAGVLVTCGTFKDVEISLTPQYVFDGPVETD